MALSADTALQFRNTGPLVTGYGTVKTGSTIYKHAMVAFDSGAKIVACANTATTHFAGIAIKGYAAGTTCEFWTLCEVRLPVTGVTAGITGDTIYSVDDETIGTATTLGPPVGTLQELDGTSYGWTRLGILTMGNSS